MKKNIYSKEILNKKSFFDKINYRINKRKFNHMRFDFQNKNIINGKYLKRNYDNF